MPDTMRIGKTPMLSWLVWRSFSELTEGHFMISLDEAMLYAPIEWQDCSEGYTDIRYQNRRMGLPKSPSTARRYATHFVR